MKSLVFRFAVGVLLCGSWVVWGDTIILQNGDRLDGKIDSETDDTAVLKLDSGQTRQIPKNQIKEVVRASSGQAGHSDARPGGRKTVAVKALPETIGELLKELLQPAQKGGIVVEIQGKEVIVDLGTQQGIKVGDKLEIVRSVTEIKHPVSGEVIGQKRDAAALLKVTSVQPRMSYCEVITGTATQKSPEGKYFQVLPAQEGTKKKCCVGRINVSRGEGITEKQLEDALGQAITGTTGLTLAESAQAESEIRAGVESDPDGCRITLTLVDRTSGQVIREAKGVHKTKLNAEDLGYRSAVSASLGVSIKLDAVKKSVESKGCAPEWIGEDLFVENAGPRSEDAWIFPDGHMVTAGMAELSSREQASRIELTWLALAETISSVNAEIKKDQIKSCYDESAEFYTPVAEQFQRLYLVNKRNYGGGYPEEMVLSWPEPTASWSSLVTYPRGMFGTGSLSLDGQDVPLTSGQSSLHDLTRLPFGEHAMAYRDLAWIVIAAHFRSPNGRIAIYDKSNKPMQTKASFSRPLSSLVIPAAPEHDGSHGKGRSILQPEPQQQIDGKNRPNFRDNQRMPTPRSRSSRNR